MGLWKYTPSGEIRNSINQGYGVTVPNSRNLPENNRANAYLTNHHGDYVALWVTDITADFEMAGEAAQSRRKKSFYAHNFQMVTFMLRGQHGSIFQSNRLAEFVRATHLSSLATKSQTVQLDIVGQGSPFGRNNRHTKGDMRPITLHGHIEKAFFGSQQYVYAPYFQLPFSVQYSRDKLFKSNRSVGSQLATESEVLQNKLESDDFERSPDGPAGTIVNDALSNANGFINALDNIIQTVDAPG
jgi:hypothetical protein